MLGVIIMGLVMANIYLLGSLHSLKKEVAALWRVIDTHSRFHVK